MAEPASLLVLRYVPTLVTASVRFVARLETGRGEHSIDDSIDAI